MPGIVRVLANNMLTMDEPDHTRLRSIVDEAFRRRAILALEPRILAIADELAGDLFAQGSPADLVDRYARRLPLSVICEVLGLPPEDRPKFMAWTSSFTRLTGALGFLGLIAAGSRRALQLIVPFIVEAHELGHVVVCSANRSRMHHAKLSNVPRILM